MDGDVENEGFRVFGARSLPRQRRNHWQQTFVFFRPVPKALAAPGGGYAACTAGLCGATGQGLTSVTCASGLVTHLVGDTPHMRHSCREGEQLADEGPRLSHQPHDDGQAQRSQVRFPPFPLTACVPFHSCALLEPGR